MNPLLSFVISVRDDGLLWATINALYLYHRYIVSEAEFVIADNSPQSSQFSERLSKHLAGFPRIKHLRYPDFPVSSCLYKEAAIRAATGRVIVGCDSHVLFAEGALDAALDYFAHNPGSKDLLTGPSFSSAMSTWPHATNQKLYTNEAYASPDGATAHNGYIVRGENFGAWVNDPRGADPNGAPFEVQRNGTGAFAMLREHWPGFRPCMYGFGGNETYLMEGVRRGGGKVMCVPGFRWVHDFMNKARHSYVRPRELKSRNYLAGVLAHGNTGLYSAVCDYFGGVSSAATQLAVRRAEADAKLQFSLLLKHPAAEVTSTEANRVAHKMPVATKAALAAPAVIPSPSGVYEQYMARWQTAGGDQAGAVPKPLFVALCHTRPEREVEGAKRPMQTLEFGAGLSTLAFDRQGTLHTAVEHSSVWIRRVREQLRGSRVSLVEAGLVERNGVTWYDWRPPAGVLYDVILIDGPAGCSPDSPGRAGCLALVPHILAPGGTIYVDDTQRVAERRLSKQLAADLDLVIARMRHGARWFDVLRSRGVPLAPGPGTELKRLFKAAGFPACQQCEALAHRMNGWGSAGCESRLEEIVDDILPRAKHWMAQNRPWATRLLGAVGIEDAALRTVIRLHVKNAISAAKVTERRAGMPT